MKAFHAILRAVNDCYPYVLMVVFVIAFLVAFAMMFIMPQISLLLLFVGLYSLALAVGLWKLSRAFERRLARSLLDRGTCPHCGHVGAVPFVSPCSECLTNFESHPAAGIVSPALGGEGGGASL